MYNLLHDEKDIDSIFFYAINGNINYLTLFYTSNNNKYKIDYKDVNFKECVDRIIKIYNILKDTKEIKLIGDLTKEIINGNIVFDKNIYNKTILNSNNYDYLSMYSYIKLIIEHTLNILDNNYILCNDNNKFYYINTISKYKELNYIYYIPIIFYKTNNGYKLKYRLINKYKEYLFDTDIKVFDKRIIVNINNKEYNGEIIFDKLNIDNTIRFKNNDIIVYSKNIENNLTDIDIKYINKIFKIINFNKEINGIKTTNYNYILYNNLEDYEYNMHLNIHKDIIRIKLKQLKKYKKDNIDFKVEEENYDYLITKYNDKYILIQQQYLISNNSNYEYKNNINKSRYYLLESDKDITNIMDANIIKKEEIYINELDDIKKLTLK